MSTQPRKLPAPPLNPENQRYFAAAAQGTLLIGKCNACGQPHFYPRVLCPHCFSENTGWIPARGTGVIYSYSTLHRGVPVPYTIAYVTLDEGVSMMTNLVDCDPSTLAIGQRVKAVFREAEDGTKIPVFTPA
ncbi:MAG: Zn-ribbon domain-containing OB-fold protein [Burkholderiales bacterium]